MIEDNKTERRYAVAIKLDKTSKYPSLAKTVYYKNDMTLDFYMRWEWYFKYREALLRVKYPKGYVELSHAGYDYTLPEEDYKKKLKNLLSAARRKKSEFEKKIEYARKSWDELFPIEDHPKWKKVMEKLQYYEARVNQLSKEYEELTQEAECLVN